MFLINALQLANPTGTSARDKIAMTANFLTQGGSNTAGTTFNTASVTPTAGRLIIFVESHIGVPADPTGIAGAGVTFTKLMTGPMEASWGGSSLWYACDAAPSTGAITITFAASHSGCRWSLAEFDCAADTADNGLGAFVQATIEAFNGITPLTTHIANSSNFLDDEHGTVYINVRNQTAAVTQTPGSGLTELSDTSFNLTVDGRNFHMAFNWAANAVVDSRFTNNNSGTYGGSYFLELRTLPAGPTAYNLAAGVGSYGLTGSVAGLKWAHKLAAGTATYTYTGATAGLKRGYKVGAASATYTYAGQAAVLRATRKLAAAVGAYVLTGSAAALRRSRFLVAGAGSYTITGFASSLRRNGKLVSSAGAYVLTGSAAVLRAARKISAGTGAYIYTGSPATLTYNTSSKTLLAGVGAYVLTGSTAGLRKAYRLTAGAGSYGITGQTANLKAARKLAAGTGSYSITGFAAALRKSYHLSVGVGTYTFTYQPAGLKHNTRLSAQSGSYIYTGSDVTLTKTERDHHPSITAEPGAYVFDYHDVVELVSTTPVYNRIRYSRSRRLGTG